MAASQASTESRVPRQIQERLARAVAPHLRAEPNTSRPAAATDPASPTDPAATAVDTPTDPRANDPTYWQQRFKVTEGMLTRERKAAKAREDETNRQIAELQTQIRDLKTAAPAATAAPIDLAEFYTPEEIERYGAEQCEAMARVALRTADKTAATRIAAEVQPLKDKQARDAQTAIEDAKTRFNDKLAELVPDFDDNDPRWRAWLAEIDEYTGAPRQAVLSIHVANLDAVGCAKVIKAWKQSIATPRPPVSPSGSGAAPAGTGDVASPTPEAVSALTPPSDAEVKEFYKLSALNKVKAPERVAFEARMKLRQRPRAAA